MREKFGVKLAEICSRIRCPDWAHYIRPQNHAITHAGTFFSRTKCVPEFVEPWANARMEAARIRTKAQCFIGRETNRKPDVGGK